LINLEHYIILNECSPRKPLNSILLLYFYVDKVEPFGKESEGGEIGSWKRSERGDEMIVRAEVI